MKTKLLTTILLFSLIQAAQAQAQQPCVFSESGFNANFGMVNAGEVAQVATVIGVKCNKDITYTLSPLTDSKVVSGTKENIEIKYYRDLNSTNQITLAKPITGVGTGEVVSHHIYLKATSTNPQAPDFGKGKVLINGAIINAPIQFQLEY